MRTLKELINEMDSQMIQYHECNNRPLIPNKETLDAVLSTMTPKESKRLLEWLVRRIYTYRSISNEENEHETD